MSLTINAAAELLSKKDKKLSKKLSEGYASCNFHTDLDLSAYMDSVTLNTKLWVTHLPNQWDEKALTQAKDALLALAGIQEVCALEGMPEKLEKLAQKLEEQFDDANLQENLSIRAAGHKRKPRGRKAAQKPAASCDEASTEPLEDDDESDDETDVSCGDERQFSVYRLRASCISFFEASGRKDMAALARGLWDNNESVREDEADMLEQIVPRLLDEPYKTVCKAILKGSFAGLD